jgi:hypothetical protein
MNEFSAKKLGEGLAFTRVGNSTLEQGYEGFRKLFMDVKLQAIQKENNEHGEELLNIAKNFKVEELVMPKSLSTETKLLEMRDTYIKDEWGNTTELCEWLGFFEGAAVVHFTLIKGIAESLNNKPLEELADRAIVFHEELLKTASLALYNIGKELSN